MDGLSTVLRNRINGSRAVIYPSMALFLVLVRAFPRPDSNLHAAIFLVVWASAYFGPILLLMSAAITRIESLVLCVWCIVVPIMLLLSALSMD